MASESYVLYAKYKLLREVLDPLILKKLDNEIDNLIINEETKITYKEYVENNRDNIIINLKIFENQRNELYNNFNNKYNKIIIEYKKKLDNKEHINKNKEKFKMKKIFINILNENNIKYNNFMNSNQIEIINEDENDNGENIIINFDIYHKFEYEIDDWTYGEINKCEVCEIIDDASCYLSCEKRRKSNLIIINNKIKNLENTLENYMDRYKNFNDINLIESLQLHTNLYDLINVYVQLYWDLYKYKLPHVK